MPSVQAFLQHLDANTETALQEAVRDSLVAVTDAARALNPREPWPGDVLQLHDTLSQAILRLQAAQWIVRRHGIEEQQP